MEKMIKNLFETNPDAVKLYQRGIVCLDPKMVAQAIDSNVDVNTPSAFYTKKNPLVELITEYSFIRSSSPHMGSPQAHADKQTAINKIVDLILAERVDFSTQDTSGQSLADMILARGSLNPDIQNSAKVVIASINDGVINGRKPYQVNFPAIFRGIIEPARSETMTSIKDILTEVARRLNNPQSEAECNIAFNHRDDLSSWFKPAVLPDLDTLPQPSQAYMDAVKSFMNSVGDVGRALQAGRPRTLADRFVFEQKLNIAQRDSEKATKITIEERRNAPKPSNGS